MWSGILINIMTARFKEHCIKFNLSKKKIRQCWKYLVCCFYPCCVYFLNIYGTCSTDVNNYIDILSGIDNMPMPAFGG